MCEWNEAAGLGGLGGFYGATLIERAIARRGVANR